MSPTELITSLTKLVYQVPLYVLLMFLLYLPTPDFAILTQNGLYRPVKRLHRWLGFEM